MSTAKEILMELLKKDGQPERLLKQYEPFEQIMTDPINQYCRGNRKRGVTSYDKWGTCILFPEDAPGPMPHVTEENKETSPESGLSVPLIFLKESFIFRPGR